MFARTELETIEAGYRRIGWDTALGSSGTIRAIADIAVAQGWSEDGITREAVDILRKRLIAAGHYDRLYLEGLTERRKPVFAGGVAILNAVVEALDLDHVQVSDGALREGILYELIGRYRNQDIRKKTVADIAVTLRCGSGNRPIKWPKPLRALFDQVRKHWRFDDADRDMLLWSAQRCMKSDSLSPTRNTTATALTCYPIPICRAFRARNSKTCHCWCAPTGGKFPVLEFDQAVLENQEKLQHLAILQRLSCVLNRSRSYSSPPDVKAVADTDSLSLKFPREWLDNHALTRADLEAEAVYLEAIEFTLKFG